MEPTPKLSCIWDNRYASLECKSIEKDAITAHPDLTLFVLYILIKNVDSASQKPVTNQGLS
jgi:hypothetical protein